MDQESLIFLENGRICNLYFSKLFLRRREAVMKNKKGVIKKHTFFVK